MEMHQLEQLKASLDELKKNVTQQADRILIQTSSNANPPTQLIFPTQIPTPTTTNGPNQQPGLFVVDPKNIISHLPFNYGSYGSRGFFWTVIDWRTNSIWLKQNLRVFQFPHCSIKIFSHSVWWYYIKKIYISIYMIHHIILIIFSTSSPYKYNFVFV